MSVKKEVVSYIKDNDVSVYKAHLHFKEKYGNEYSQSQVYQWWQKREQILGEKCAKKRCLGGGRNPRLGELEDILFDNVLEMRGRNMKVSRCLIRATAETLAEQEGIRGFKAGATWCNLFMSRFKLSLRRRTNLTTLTEDTLIQRCVDYMAYLNFHKPAIRPERTLLMDETAIYFEDSRMQTVDFEGRRHVVIKSTGFASMRITACVSFWGDGRKAPPPHHPQGGRFKHDSTGHISSTYHYTIQGMGKSGFNDPLD